eukprot:gene11390-biopygen9074
MDWMDWLDLQLHSYCFVNRHLVTVSDSKVIVLACSCDESKKDFLKSISFHYVGEPDAFTQLITSQFPDCLHLKVASELIPTIDKVNNIDPFEINSYIVEDDHEYAKAIDSDNDSLPDFVVDMIATHNALQESSIRSVFVRPVSYELFKWETTLQQRRIYRLYKELSSSFLPDGTLALVPPGDPCNVCGGPMTSVVGEDGLKPLFLLADSVNVTVSAALSYYPIDDQFLSVMEEVRAGAVLQCCPEKLLLVRRKAPIMHDFLISLPKESVANEVNGLLLEMESRIGWIIGKDPHRLPYVTEEAQLDFSFLPNWPVLNERGAYAKDVSSSKKVSKDCRKDYRGHPSLMPGIFTLHCMHGIVFVT